MFWGFSRLDIPIIRFIRSLQNHGGIPDNRWFVIWSDWGDWIGKGDVLFTISASLLIAGLIFKRTSLRWAGIESAVAHAVAGLVGLAMKYVIGRPRPKFMHGNEWVMSPSLESGMHSFPSGHSYASFAVAVVLAKHFPRLGWMVYGLAAMIMISRVIRGAHFPSDVAVGMAFGLLVGVLVCDPLGNRWYSAKDMLGKAAIGVGVFFSIVWVATHIPQQEGWETLSKYVGLFIIVTGMILRIWQGGRRSEGWLISPIQLGTGLIGWGLVVSTGSFLVIVVGTLLVMIHMLNGTGSATYKVPDIDLKSTTGWRLAAEGLVAVTSAAAYLFLQGITGIVPFA